MKRKLEKKIAVIVIKGSVGKILDKKNTEKENNRKSDTRECEEEIQDEKEKWTRKNRNSNSEKYTGIPLLKEEKKRYSE